MLSNYLGLNVLEEEPDYGALGGAQDELRLRMEILESPVGAREPIALGAYPRYRRTLRFHLFTQDDRNWIRSFFDGQLGRLRPFWIPSWEHDVTVAAALSGALSGMVIRWIGYSLLLFPAGKPRRHFYLYQRAGDASEAHEATAAADNGDGTETVSFAAPPAMSGYPTIASFLRLVRFDTDVLELRWSDATYATCDLPVLEVPGETP